ncbi:Vacuolar protein sorting-associated protein 41 [Haplosporangium bisporale]|nr:Vacuolar protein sorting-associated protein 41 [Haplosporangium bisporale]
MTSPQTPFWEPDWKSVQAPLSALRRQLASFPSPPLRIMKVSQLDAELLDDELLETMKEQLWSAFALFKPTFKDKFKPELTLALNLIMYKFSVYDMGATYGSQLQNLVYRNERKHSGGLQSTATDAHLTKTQKIVYGVVTVGGQYVMERVNGIVTEQGWGELPEDNIKRKAWNLLQKGTSAFKIFSLVNFLAFLYAGKYRTILERILSMRLVYAERNSNRQASFEFLNRQMVWHAFTEFLMFLMPLINVSKLKRNVKRMLLPAALMSANELSALPAHICAICHESNTAAPTTTPGNATSTFIHNPYITDCGHIYCYYCVKTKMMIDDEWCCLRCGKKVDAIARHVEVAPDKALIEKTDQEEEEESEAGGMRLPPEFTKPIEATTEEHDTDKEPDTLSVNPSDEHHADEEKEASEEEEGEEGEEESEQDDGEEEEEEQEEEQEEEETESEEEEEDDDEDEEEEEEENEEEDSDEEEEESEEEEDEEPKLNYQRLGAGIGNMLKKDSASATTVSERFLAMGTYWGVVHIMDFEGNENQKFQAHQATVNDLSVDLEGEYVASASDDGKVVINGLFTQEHHVFNYKRPLKAVALEPDYAKSTSKQFVSGGMAGQLILNEKGWFGNRDVVLHSGEGPIYAIKWRGNLIAWSNDLVDFIVCGIAPFGKMLLLMAYNVDNIDEIAHITGSETTERKMAKRPELRIINAYNEEISSDALTLHGFAHYQANEYMFEHLPSQDMFYIGSPKDLVVAKERDADDHIQWLMERERYEEALHHAREAQVYGGSKKFNASEIGQKYLGWLLEREEYDKAATQCPSILGSDADLWEHWIYAFAEARQLKSFPPGLYNIQNVIVAVEDRLKQDKDNILLMESLAKLYTLDNRADRALEYFLRLRRPNVFELIRNHNLYSTVKDKAVLLMEFDQYLYDQKFKEIEEAKKGKRTTEPEKHEKTAEEELTQGPAVQMMIEHTEEIPIKHVVPQLKDHPRLLHIYLDALFLRDPHLGFEFHDLQVELYATYAPGRLIDFLRASNYYSLERAYRTCEKRDLVPEMVFLLGRMGDNKKALMLIIERLGDVERAINFAKEQNDDDLWEDLLKYSMDKPQDTMCSICQQPIFDRSENRVPGAPISTFVVFFCRHVFHDKCLFADDEETMPRIKSSLTRINLRTKANHAALIRSKRGRTPCPLCLDQAKLELTSNQ